MKKLLCIFLFVPLALFGQSAISYQLDPGWNMVGFTACEITPIEEAFNTALPEGKTMEGTFELIKDVRGNFWNSELGDYSTLKELVPGEGYMVYVNHDGQAPSLQFSESYCNDIAYQLNPGWNMFAFTGNEESDNDIVRLVDAALSESYISESFELIKNVTGRFWTASFDMLQEFTPGEAYLGYVLGNQLTLSFTENKSQVFYGPSSRDLPFTDNNMSVTFPSGTLSDFIGYQTYAIDRYGNRVSEDIQINENGSAAIPVIGSDSSCECDLADQGEELSFAILIDETVIVITHVNPTLTYSANTLIVVDGDDLSFTVDGAPAVFGCTDVEYFEYNSSANIDDESCSMLRGCTDSSSCVYNPDAIYDDGSCIYESPQSDFNTCCLNNLITSICPSQVDCDAIEIDCVYPGCMSDWADNYDPFATEDDSSCYKNGCTLDWADNFDSLATYNDGSCIRRGCISNWADNYDELATENNNSCYRWGCTLDWADNYDELATKYDDSCYRIGCTKDWADNYDELATENNCSCYRYGCTKDWADNYDDLATENDGSCYGDDFHKYNGIIEIEEFSFYPPVTDNNMAVIFSPGTLSDFAGELIMAFVDGNPVSEAYTVYSDGSVGIPVIGTDPSCECDLADSSDELSFAILIDETVIVITHVNPPLTYSANSLKVVGDGYDLSFTVDGAPAEFGCADTNYLVYDPTSDDLDGSCTNLIIRGCTDITYLEYNSSANFDDQSCSTLRIDGCTFSFAYNYNALANTDDGSCMTYEEFTIDSLQQALSVLDSTWASDYFRNDSTWAANYYNTKLALDSWNTTIDLAAGWNMFGYGCPAPIDLVQAMSEHTDNIIIIKDNSGKAYMPQYNFNGIGDLTPGLGYQIKVTEAIEGFSLCDWYVNDIPEDNIISLQDSIVNMHTANCIDDGYCGFDNLKQICISAEEGYDCNGDILQFSLSFDGNDDYLYMDSLIFLHDEFTFSVKIKSSQVIGNEGPYNPLIYFGDRLNTNNENSDFEVYFGNNGITVVTNRSSSSGEGHYFTSPFDYSDWLTLTVSYNSGLVSIYFDGVLSDSHQFSNTSINSNYNDLFVGSFMFINRYGLNESYFNGKINDIIFWNKSLTEFEVQSKFNYNLAMDENLVGYWNLNEGSGNTVYDISGNGNHGTINGAVYSDDVP